MDGEVIEAKVKDTSLETVNRHLLTKLDDLIESVDAKSNPELVKVLTESVAKLNSSFKGNEIFAPQETAEERVAREQKEVLEGMLTNNG
jgi:hypothetical protein